VHVPIATLIAFAALVLPAGTAGAAERSVSADLDGDGAAERVVARQLCEAIDGGSLRPAQPPCGDGEFPRQRIEIEDSCSGQLVTHVASSVQDNVYRLRVREADGLTGGPEVFFDLRSGATGRGGDIRVVRLDQSGGCSVVRTLFRYPARATRGAIPKRRGAVGRDSFSVSVRELQRRYRGRELRVTETYVDRDDAFCCPSFRRVSLWFFARNLDSYVRYKTRVKRIKARGKRP
jgi:hypothetical protein